MRWKRIRVGLYRSGDYEVGLTAYGEWYCEGPGADCTVATKREAQRVCERAHLEVAS